MSQPIKRGGYYVPAATIRDELQQHLKDTGMTWAFFAKESGLKHAAIRKLVLGQTCKVSVTSQAAIRDAFIYTQDMTELPETLPVGPIADALHVYALARHMALGSLLGRAETRALTRALEVGRCGTLWADRMSCHVLGRPLELIYGPTWDTDHLKEVS
jgi:hypothetical protein